MKLFVLALAVCPAFAAELLSVGKIWDQAPHNAFTDLVRYRGVWFCTFREDASHVSATGKVRVIESLDGKNWVSSALLAEAGIDLRDPKFAVAPDGRLMMVMGGSVMEDGRYVRRQPRVAFSKDGRAWSKLERILGEGDWLWRVTWHKNTAFGVSYWGGGGLRDTPRRVFLHAGSDGVRYRLIGELDAPESNETTLRFTADGEMIALVRGTKEFRIGASRAPYRDWSWKVFPSQIGGPNFIMLPDGRWIAGMRGFNKEGPETVLAWMTREALTTILTLPSRGDNSYPGLVWHEGELWVSYYSSHEGKANIYLARVRL